MKYKEKFDKEVKGKRPQYDMKESKIYKTLKDANELASEVGAQQQRLNHLLRHGFFFLCHYLLFIQFVLYIRIFVYALKKTT